MSKPERAREPAQVASEHDLTREDLLAKIAVPFVRGGQFFCGGSVVHSNRVQEVKFSRTQQSAKELAPFILARRKIHAIASFASPETDVIWEGEDVTREILDGSGKVTVDFSTAKQAKSDRLFIVHGHDEKAVDQTELLVRRFGLTPIILRDAPSTGLTVIEKFEAHSNVGFAIVLLTPDDFGGKDRSHLLSRARQNVIWEWGYLVAKLGRHNVVCLYRDGVEMPSDLHGLVTIHIAQDVREKAEEIRRELKAAGYDIP